MQVVRRGGVQGGVCERYVIAAVAACTNRAGQAHQLMPAGEASPACCQDVVDAPMFGCVVRGSWA